MRNTTALKNLLSSNSTKIMGKKIKKLIRKVGEILTVSEKETN